MDLIKKVRKYLKDNHLDYLLVNSTNEFLVEYNDLEENSRYLLTKFSGSTGEALISQKDIFLFVDGRYHEQADLEVDKNLVTVIKMKVGESFVSHLSKKIHSGKTLAVVAKKISQGNFEILTTMVKKKNAEITLLPFDPVMQEFNVVHKKNKCEKIDVEIAGMSSDAKFDLISKNLNEQDAILTTNLEEISSLCNLRDFSSNYSSKITRAKCLITSCGVVLFSDCTIKLGNSFEIKPLDEFELYIQNLNIINTIFVDKITINANDYKILGDKAVGFGKNYIKEMKSVKNQAEIEHYKKSFEKTDKALYAIREYIEQNENLSEADVSSKLEEYFYKFGAKSLSFKSIVAKDKNAALAHYSKNSKTEILKDGSLLLIDCGAYYEGGYATDCTRVFVKGSPTKLQKKVYTTVLKGFLKAFNKKINSKTTGFSLDRAARKILEENKPSGFEFSHSLGHGIGIGVHESPPSLAFSPLAKTPLVENMCFTIEPGLYNAKHFGVRLENSCYIEKDGESLVIKSFSDMCFEDKLIDYDLLTPTEKRQLKKFKVK